MPIREKKVLVAGSNEYVKELKSKFNFYSFKTYCYTGEIQGIETKITLCQPDAVIILGSDELIKETGDVFQEFIATPAPPFFFIFAGVKEGKNIQKLLEFGADIIQNPLEKNITDIIALKVKNLFDSMARFENKNWLSLIDKTFNDSNLSDDETFLKATIELISANIDNYKFSVSDLAFAVNLSERQLYRRVKALTSYTPAALIREIRLQRARKLVKGRKIKTKMELANKVGYKSTSHFCNAYAERFEEDPDI